MRIYPYPKSESRPDGGFTADEITSGQWTLRADVECTVCGKAQSLAMAGSTDNGQCIKCGGKTS